MLFPYGDCLKGGGGVKACQYGLEHFFPTFARWCKGLPGWFEALFSTFARLTEGGGSKVIWAMPIRNNTFQKGTSLNHNDDDLADRIREVSKAISDLVI